MVGAKNELLLLLLFCLAATASTFMHPHRRRHQAQNHTLREKTPAPLCNITMFSPLPEQALIALCEWGLVNNTMVNRSPRTILEYVCLNGGDECGGRRTYRCGELRDKFPVSYTDAEGGETVHTRDMSFSMGCGCIRRPSNKLQQFNMPIPE